MISSGVFAAMPSGDAAGTSAGRGQRFTRAAPTRSGCRNRSRWLHKTAAPHTTVGTTQVSFCSAPLLSASSSEVYTKPSVGSLNSGPPAFWEWHSICRCRESVPVAPRISRTPSPHNGRLPCAVRSAARAHPAARRGRPNTARRAPPLHASPGKQIYQSQRAHPPRQHQREIKAQGSTGVCVLTRAKTTSDACPRVADAASPRNTAAKAARIMAGGLRATNPATRCTRASVAVRHPHAAAGARAARRGQWERWCFFLSLRE